MSKDNTLPLFSIIIPLYNKAPYIKRAIDSVLSQTVQNFELIIVGGKSTDGSEDIVLSYHDSRIRLIQESGIGVSAARNQGVSEAKADLVAFLDADDEWPEHYIEMIVQLRTEYPDAGIYATNYSFGSDKMVEYNSQYLDSDYHGELDYFYHCAVEERAPFATSSVTIPKRIYNTVGGFDIRHSYNEDTELFGKIALQYPVVIDTRIRVYYHTEDPSSLSKHPPRNYTHPFLEVIANISESDCTINYSSLQLYADSIKLESAMLNLWNGDDAMYCYHMKTLRVHKNHRKKIILLKLYHMIPVVIRSNKRFKDLVYSLRQIMR